MGAAEGLAKSEGKAPIDHVARVAKAPRALLALRDLAESERVRKREAIVVCDWTALGTTFVGSRRGLLDEPPIESRAVCPQVPVPPGRGTYCFNFHQGHDIHCLELQSRLCRPSSAVQNERALL